MQSFSSTEIHYVSNATNRPSKAERSCSARSTAQNSSMHEYDYRCRRSGSDHTVLSCHAADVCPNAFLNIRVNEIKSVLGAKNNVVITMGICVCHVIMRSLTRRGHIIMHAFRGLKHHGYFHLSLCDIRTNGGVMWPKFN